MIQIYSPNNTDYEKNGDMTLLPESAAVHVILNDTWEAELIHEMDEDGRWKYIEREAVVKMPSFNGDQLFRIKETTKTDTQITASMEPIFMDAMDDCFLVDVRPTNKSGQQALDIMTAPNSKYSGQSDITTGNTAYYEYMNLIEAINGDNENSFVSRWGGEILYNNYTVIINERVGGDYGYEIRYGKNIPENGIQEEVDIRDLVTRIYPKGYNGVKMSGSGYVDSPLINRYVTVKCAAITFDDVKMAEDAGDDEEEGTIICNTQQELDTALRQKCNEQYEDGIDKPKVTISADMVILKNTEQYKEYEVLEDVSLGDTIHCIHSKLGIDTKARIIELEYDSILDKVSSVVIGDFQYSYFDNVSSTVDRIETAVNSAINSDGTIMADRVRGVLNAINTQLKYQKNVAQKQDVRAILFEDTDPDSPTYGAMCLGTQGFQISNKRTTDGKDWDWTTAFTADGGYANVLIAGLLSDKTGRSFWNLDNGEIQISGLFRTVAQNGYDSIRIKDNTLYMYDYSKKNTSAENTVLMLISALDNQANYGNMLTYKKGRGFSICRHSGDFGIITEPVMTFEVDGENEIGVYQKINMNNYSITNQSDERLKDNIKLVQNGELGKIMKIPIVSFDWLTDGKHEDAGVIAQDIESLFPDCVTEDKEGVKQVIPIKLLYHVIKSIQEINDKIDGTNTVQGRIDPYTKEEKQKFVNELKKKEQEEMERRIKNGEHTS